MTRTDGLAPRRGLPRGIELLHDPLLNKGTAFTEEERERLGLRGLLPPHVFTLEGQVARVLEAFGRKESDLERYLYLTGLQDRNETLFYRTLVDHLELMMPVVYTPTVGLACQLYSHLFRRTRGLWIAPEDRGRVIDVLRNWPRDDVRVMVMTDGERILGLGDQGAGGMGIPIGKLSLYTACGGIHPASCLPVMIDVGTDNPALRADPLYMGRRSARERGAAYHELVGEIVTAASRLWPHVLVQFEDFASSTAFELLEEWRDRACAFNDDIQGTAAVTLAGLLGALRITRKPLVEQRLLFLGAGEAATGIADLVASAMVDEGARLEQARRHIWLVDSKGLVVSSRRDLARHKVRYAHDAPAQPDFAAAVRALRPTAIIGVSAVPKAFDRAVIEAASQASERPIVFALSNPTSKAECTAEEAYSWSHGRAIFASGSPFPPCTVEGTAFVPGQCNNAYVFPGVGLGVVASRARRVTDRMFLCAARTLAAETTEADLRLGRLFPPLSSIREVSAKIGAAVAEVAFSDGLAGVPRPPDVPELVRAQMWTPRYEDYL